MLPFYKVAYRVAKRKQLYTVVEHFNIISNNGHGISIEEAAAEQLTNTQLSDTVISRRVLDLAEDINDPMIDDKVKGESTIGRSHCY